jgi:nucleoside-diphosphate-sugar epimerase
MSLVGKKILVLGGNGYVGNYFASRLVKEAGTVSAMSRYAAAYIGKDPNTNIHKTTKYNG